MNVSDSFVFEKSKSYESTTSKPLSGTLLILHVIEFNFGHTFFQIRNNSSPKDVYGSEC